MRFHSPIQILAGLLLVSAGAVRAAGRVDFNREVRPIVAENCFTCHGPDAKTLKGNLRLDVRDSAVHPAKSGEIAIVPGKPDASELMKRVLTDDPDEHMPPAKTEHKLTPAQIDTLRRWIGEGAEYAAHWAFLPPQRLDPPPAPAGANVKNPIDNFILAGVQQAGLKPSPEAEKPVLIRRVTLDLTGLPPTPQEVDAFLADASPDAYEKLVDRLLASPRYGERMAMEWMDAARFADTHGYHIDGGRDMTRWRDWVIDAFNANKRFDEFTVEQLAGDLLPNATVEQKIASGFHRNHMINFEGGAIPDEYHTAYVMDRVVTTSTVWLGVTMICAQCHDHKYDPLTMKDFYSMYAFFNNVPENGLDGSKGNAAPVLKLPPREGSAQQKRLEAEIAAAQQAEKDAEPRLAAAQAEWEKSAGGAAASWEAVRVESAKSTGGATLSIKPDSVLATGANPAADSYEIMCVSTQAGDSVLAGFKLEALLDDSLVGKGPGRAPNGNFVLSEVSFETTGGRQKLDFAAADYSQANYAIASTIDGNAKSGWAVDGDKKHEPRTAWFALEKPAALKAGQKFRITLRFESGIAQHGIGRFRLSTTSSPLLARTTGLPLDNSLAAMLKKPAAQRTVQEAAALREAFRQNFSPEAKQLRERIAAAQKALAGAGETLQTVMVMEEKPGLRQTFMLERGQYDKKTTRVTADTPAALPPMKPEWPKNRLGLASWIMAPENPLTARVTVNRYWQMYFGNGIVKSAENLGVQADWPSHPELLDWLATEFIRTGWDVKAMQRLLVTSATYRQSARATPEHLEKDSENRLLARGPRVRLHAEFIRDLALSVSGLLNPVIGGASVNPYQPAGLWEELMAREDGDKFSAQKFVQSKGADLYRRGMYTFWKRTCPPVNLGALDAPDREVCTVRRPRTNTPLQALCLMNDPVFVEAARKLAERLLREAPDDASRIALAFKLVLSRTAKPAEAAALQTLKEEQLRTYRADAKAAGSLLQVGESPRDPALDPAELAAWTLAASALLNLDEAITK